MTWDKILIITAVALLCGILGLCFYIVSALKKRQNDSSVTRQAEQLARLESAQNNTQNTIIVTSNSTQNAVQNSLGAFREEVLGASKTLSDNLSGSIKLLSEHLNLNSGNLQTQTQNFYKMVDEKLEKMRVDMSQNLVQARHDSQKQLEKMSEDNQKQLDKMRETVDEKLTSTLNKRISESFSMVTEKLESVNKSLGEMKSLGDGVSSLNKVLGNIKTRGTWGELALDNLLSQMLSKQQYHSQFRLKEKSEIMDFAIVLPGDEEQCVYLPIDAKFPIADYQKLVEASENADKIGVEMALKALVLRVKDCAKSIKEKYVQPPLTTDFAIMYVPIEGLFAEIVRRDGLCEELQQKYKVIVCGPTTIAALLNSIQLGFRTLAIKNNSHEIQQLLGVFKKEFENFAMLIDKTKKQVDTVSVTMGNAQKRTQSISKKLKNVESLSSGSTAVLGIEIGAEAFDDEQTVAADAEEIDDEM